MQGILKSRIITGEDGEVLADENVLGIIEYGTESNQIFFNRKLNIPYQFIKEKNISENYAEVWYTSEKVKYLSELCYVAQSDSYYFSSVSVETDKEYLKCSQEAYERLLQKLDTEKFVIIRFWNYIPNINEIREGEEVYKEFCWGRECIFKKYFREGLPIYPAATGIGFDGRKLCVSLIAVSKQSLVKNIENPRQTPAFLYPKRYGIASPKFSRAMYFANDRQQLIVLSGTASIIEAKTIGINDTITQTLTTIENIFTLMSDVNLKKYGINNFGDKFNLRYLKIYIKNWRDYPKVKEICEQKFNKKNLFYQQSNICRSELLVEIEGVFER